MTDTYEPGDDHHDSGAEQAMAHDGPVNEEPSTYEFDEHGGPATAEEEPHEDLGTQTRETQPGGRSATLPVIAAIIGVVLLGGAAWWQFGPSSTPSAPAPQTAMTVPQPIAPATPVPVAQTTADSAPMKPIASLGDNTMPSSPAANDIGQPAPATNVSPPIPAPTVSASAAAGLPAVSAAAPAPIPAAMPVTAASSTALPPATGSDTQRIDALTARIDSLQKALDQANNQLSQMSGQLSSSGAPADKSLQDRFDKMEHELAELRHSAPSLAAPVALPSDMQVSEVHETSRTPVTAAAHKTRHHKPVTAAKPVIAEYHSKKQAAASQTLPEPKANWVLRAATPDQAWVSTSATSSDLKPLQVGDNLPGIGRVVAIQHQGDNWVVQGTQGTIH